MIGPGRKVVEKKMARSNLYERHSAFEPPVYLRACQTVETFSHYGYGTTPGIQPRAIARKL